MRRLIRTSTSRTDLICRIVGPLIAVGLVGWAVAKFPSDIRTETQRRADALAIGCTIMGNAADCEVVEAYNRFGAEAASAVFAMQRANGIRH
jgi:hypothetical protein